MAVTQLGCFIQQALDGLIQTNKGVAQTIADALTVTGALTTTGGVVNPGNSTVTGTMTVTGAAALNGGLTVVGSSALGVLTWAPSIQTCAGSADAVLFANALNIAMFTSTGPDSGTLATPIAGDNGKILILVNTNTTQNVVATAAGKILSGAASAGGTLTAPAHAGAVCVLVAANLFWNMIVGGTGSWVVS